jgi:hypothetical protein
MSDIMVCYGKDNNGQAYGGGIIYGNRYIQLKPCLINITDTQYTGIVFIQFDGPSVGYSKYDGNMVIRVIVYGR